MTSKEEVLKMAPNNLRKNIGVVKEMVGTRVECWEHGRCEHSFMLQAAMVACAGMHRDAQRCPYTRCNW